MKRQLIGVQFQGSLHRKRERGGSQPIQYQIITSVVILTLFVCFRGEASPLKDRDALKALRHPQGISEGLRYLLSTSVHTLKVADSPLLFRQVISIACASTHEDRLSDQGTDQIAYARAAVEVLKRKGIHHECLEKIWRQTAQPPRSIYGQHQTDLLARETVQLLAQQGRVDLLSGSLQHPDPEIRAIAARRGVDPEQLCSLMSDRWSFVRRAAVLGIEEVALPSGICLTELLNDSSLLVSVPAAEALGRLATAAWAQRSSPPKILLNSLNDTAQDQQAVLVVRLAALLALARWGQYEVALKYWQSHLQDGGLVPISLGALDALVLSGSVNTLEVLQQALIKSRSIEIKLRGAYLLVDPRVRWHQSDYTRADRLLLLDRAIKSAVGDRLLLSKLTAIKTELLMMPGTRKGDELAPAIEDEDD